MALAKGNECYHLWLLKYTSGYKTRRVEIWCLMSPLMCCTCQAQDATKEPLEMQRNVTGASTNNARELDKHGNFWSEV